MNDFDSAGEVFRAGFRLLGCGRNGRVRELVEQALLEFPDDGPLWELLGVAQARLADFPATVKSLEHASLLKPLDTGARLYLAMGYAATGSRDLAVFVYRLISGEPRTPNWMLTKVARQLGEMGEFQEALEVCQALVERDPQRHEAHFGIGYYLRRLGARPGQVLEPIARATELAPDNPLYRAVLECLTTGSRSPNQPGGLNPPFALDWRARLIWTDFVSSKPGIFLLP